MESFIAQLDDASELLLGIHEADREATSRFVERMLRDYPHARIEIVYRSGPDDVANPKIAWQRILAPHARGELWLWSDADIVAPPGFLESARQDYEQGGAGMVTFPYIIREIPSTQALLDTLFVNVEFYPGLLLLQSRGPVDFGLGSAMLFSRADFERRGDWKKLGASLADDFVLGQMFQPVLIGRTTFVTSVDAVGWGEAILHNLRWNKTVLWNRPLGFAGRAVGLPVMGWLAYLVLHPAQPLAWLGFLAMIQIDVFFAAAICRKLGCRIGVWNLLAMELWSLWRICVWVGCWLPWPVNWRGQLWWGPRKN